MNRKFHSFLRNKPELKSKVPAIQIPDNEEKLAVRIQMTTPTGLGEIKANFFSPSAKMLMTQFMVARAIAIMTSSRRKRRAREEQVQGRDLHLCCPSYLLQIAI